MSKNSTWSSSAWSEAETAELIRLHALMYSAREMAELLKRPSRNSILGKLFRLGLSLDVSPAHIARRTSWTKERVAVLRHMQVAGKTVAEIAARLGSTPSAIRSKAKELAGQAVAGQPVAGQPVGERGADQQARRYARRGKARGGSRMRPKPLPASEMARHPPGTPVPFLKAGKGHCRYPLYGAERLPLEQRFICGAHAEPGWSYCREHHKLCHVRPK